MLLERISSKYILMAINTKNNDLEYITYPVPRYNMQYIAAFLRTGDREYWFIVYGSEAKVNKLINFFCFCIIWFRMLKNIRTTSLLWYYYSYVCDCFVTHTRMRAVLLTLASQIWCSQLQKLVLNFHLGACFNK